MTIVNERRLNKNTNPRILRLLLRQVDFNFAVVYLPGSANVVADTLSRHPTSAPTAADVQVGEAANFDVKLMCARQASAAVFFRLERVQREAENDVQYQDLKRQIQSGFPESKSQLPDHLRQFWTVRHDLTVSDDEFVLYGTRLLIPTALRPQILSELHKDHRGIDRTRERARLVVYRLSIDQHIHKHCQNCEQCFANISTQRREPLHHLPRPYREFVSSDLFHSHGKTGICYTDWSQAGSVIPSR